MEKFVYTFLNNKERFIKYDANFFQFPENFGKLSFLRFYNKNKKFFNSLNITVTEIDKLSLKLTRGSEAVYITLKPITYDGSATNKKGCITRARYKHKPPTVKNMEDLSLKSRWINLGVYPTGNQDIYVVIENDCLKKYNQINETDKSCWINLENIGLCIKENNGKLKVQKTGCKDFNYRLFFEERYLLSFLQMCFEEYSGGFLDDFDINKLVSEKIEPNEFHVNLVDNELETSLYHSIFPEIEELDQKYIPIRRSNNLKFKEYCHQHNIHLHLSSDSSFQDKNGYLISEVHHIIPFKFKDCFDKIDSFDNLILLSPNAHKGIHHGKEQVQVKIMKDILEIKRKELEKVIYIDKTLDNEKVAKEIINTFYK